MVMIILNWYLSIHLCNKSNFNIEILKGEIRNLLFLKENFKFINFRYLNNSKLQKRNYCN